MAPKAASQLGQGLSVFGMENGLPDLPDARIWLFTSAEADPGIVADGGKS